MWEGKYYKINTQVESRDLRHFLKALQYSVT